MWKRERQAANFGSEWMMLPVACRIQPQDLTCGARCRQRVQHRQNWCRSDSRAEQHQRPLAGLQNESSARRADVESIPDTNMVPQPGSSCAIRLNFHADAIALRREGTGE